MVKLSVIVPVYNVERYLDKCLKSLVEQTLEEIEIIVVNDGSTDRSQDIIDDYQQRFPQKIKAFAKENGGLSDARNYGIDCATGDFIGFVDSDDYITPEMFQDLYGLSQKHGAEFVSCNLQKVDEKGEITQKLTQIPQLSEKIDLEKEISVFSDISYFACNKIFKKELFKNKRFKKGAHFEDIELIPQLLLECKTIAHSHAYHYQYLERSDSITKTHTERGLDILRAVETVEHAFATSAYSKHQDALKNFQILEGVYTFLAYLAFVKDPIVYKKMTEEFTKFISERGISKVDILRYNRFGKNYLLSLPIKKIIFYLLFLYGFSNFIRKIL